CSLVEGEVDVSLSEPHGLREGQGCPPKGNYYQKKGGLDQNRKQRKNHTSKLHELALLLPLAPKTSSKKLTKKEILQHILHYIQYLQRNIDVAQALLQFHTANGEGGAGGLGQNAAVGSAGQRHFAPSSCPHSCQSYLWEACRRPRKKKLTRASGTRCVWAQSKADPPPEPSSSDKAPALSDAIALLSQTPDPGPEPLLLSGPVKPKKQVTPSPDQKGGNVEGTSTPPRCCDRNGGRSRLTLLDVAKNSKNNVQDDGLYPAFGAQHGAERTYFLYRTQPRCQLVSYDSSEEMDKEAPDTDPWLPAWTQEGSPHGSPLALEPPHIDNWSVMGQPSEILGLSPSLFSSPGKLLSEQVLEEGSEYLTQALFEEVFLDPVSSPSACVLEVPPKKESSELGHEETPVSAHIPSQDTPPEAPEDLSDSHSPYLSSVSLGHLSLSEDSQASSVPSSEGMDTDTDTELVWGQQEAQANPEDLKFSSDEDGDYTWTPTRRASTLPSARRKSRRGQADRGPMTLTNKKDSCPTQPKKKCVNGFIMFCRMNRKQYIRACPGTASTTATKQLAQLWREMTEQERRPYSIKARRFSRRHNRIVKQESSSSEDEDSGVPKPFYQLLADRLHSSFETWSQ
ncbi:PREDICTED: basic helix-loop-helix and HMG box domain-containing protein 1, partial [Myotis davidii]|uniref:basic helix-loop-helix and HMG box domain-containing protein 1 n=1 Tax=Myotis davidii TaxID=225400 RepID=UPI000767D0AD